MKQIFAAIFLIVLVTGCAEGRGGNDYYGTGDTSGTDRSMGPDTRSTTAPSTGASGVDGTAVTP